MKKKIKIKNAKIAYGATVDLPDSGIYVSNQRAYQIVCVVSRENNNTVVVLSQNRPNEYGTRTYNFRLALAGVPGDVANIIRNGAPYEVYRQSGSDRFDLDMFRRMLSMHKMTETQIERDNFTDFVNKLTSACKKTRNVELGVELELEHRCGRYAVSIAREDMPADLVHDVGTDGSVSGVEIRFKHPQLKEWKTKAVDEYLEALKTKEFGFDRNSAGMHIHVSGTDISHFVKLWGIPGHQNATQDEVRLLQQILYPTSDRPTNQYYGVGLDMVKINSEFNTVEFRVWRATLNPWVFKTRIELAKRLFEHVCSGKSLKTFFADMPKAFRSSYCRLVRSCNYHSWGDENIVNTAIAGGTL